MKYKYGSNLLLIEIVDGIKFIYDCNEKKMIMEKNSN